MFSSFGWRIQMYSTHLEPTEGSWVRKKGGCTRLAHSVWPATGPAPAAGGAAGLVLDLAVGQRLFQFGNAHVGDLGAVHEIEALQIGHSLEVRQARITDFGAGEAEIFEPGQALKMHQPGARDLGRIERERRQTV